MLAASHEWLVCSKKLRHPPTATKPHGEAMTDANWISTCQHLPAGLLCNDMHAFSGLRVLRILGNGIHAVREAFIERPHESTPTIIMIRLSDSFILRASECGRCVICLDMCAG